MLKGPKQAVVAGLQKVLWESKCWILLCIICISGVSKAWPELRYERPPHQKGATVNQMHVDNSFNLSFQLCIHCQHITAVYSFQTGSGKLTFFFYAVWLMICCFIFSSCTHLLLHERELIIYCVLLSKMKQTSADKHKMCVLKSCKSPQSLFNTTTKKRKKKDVRGFPAKTIGQLLIVKQDGLDNRLLHPRPSSTWPQTSLSRGGDFQFLSYTKICPPAEPLTYDSAVWEHLICNAWIRKLRGLKGK